MKVLRKKDRNGKIEILWILLILKGSTEGNQLVKEGGRTDRLKMHIKTTAQLTGETNNKEIYSPKQCLTFNF